MFLRVNHLHEDLSTTGYKQNQGNGDFDFFGPVGDLNLFIGSNNSGKSRFLRGLLKSKKYNLVSNIDTLNNISKIFEICKNIESTPLDINLIASFNLPSQKIPPISEDKSNIEYKYLLQLKNCINELITANQNETPKLIQISKKYFQSLKTSIQEDWDQHNSEKLSQNIFHYRRELDIAILLTHISPGFIREYFPGISFQNNIHQSGISTEPDILEIISTLESLEKTIFKSYEVTQKIYIPILRSAISLNDNVFKNILSEKVDYNYGLELSKNPDIKVFTGQELYSEIRKSRNSKKANRLGFEAFEAFLSEYFFQNRELEIVAIEDSEIVIKEINEKKDTSKEYHISFSLDGEENNLPMIGDGVQALIILMYPIFTAPNNSIIFIEEPEINLHPGLQRIFIEQIFNNNILKKKNLRYFITTHSNHFLDLSLELNESVSINTFEKKRRENKNFFQITNVKNKDNNALQLLEVNNSSVFLANCSIWVEGISDRYYIRAFLKAFYDHYKDYKFYKEDINYTIFEYGGSNIMHYTFWEEIEEKDLDSIKGHFINNKVFLISDQDKNKEKKHDRFTKNMSNYFTYRVLNVKEIENILSPEQLKDFLPKAHKSIKSSTLKATPLDQKKYSKEYLGTYLTDLNIGIPKTIKSAKGSGTLSSAMKIKLAKTAYENITWKDMSTEARKLANELYSFINKSNRNVEEI